MKILTNQPVNIKDANLEMLTPIQQVNMLPDKVVVFESLEGIGLEGYFNIQGAILFLVKRGSCTIELDLKKYELNERSCLIALPNQIAKISQISNKVKFVCVACSLSMVEDLMAVVNEAISLTLKAKQQPVLKLGFDEYGNILQSFNYLITKLKKSANNPYCTQIVKNALLSLVYECIGIMTKEENIIPPSSKKDALFNSFINLVSQNHKVQHNVAYYASRLFITPKYMTRVVEEVSDKSAKQWIDEYIALEAKMMLRSTQKTIQEISDELNFPDMSFFGKFFKRMVGMSPKAYRLESE